MDQGWRFAMFDLSSDDWEPGPHGGPIPFYAYNVLRYQNAEDAKDCAGQP